MTFGRKSRAVDDLLQWLMHSVTSIISVGDDDRDTPKSSLSPPLAKTSVGLLPSMPAEVPFKETVHDLLIMHYLCSGKTSVLFLGDGQDNGKGRPLTQFRFCPDPPIMLLND